MDELTTLASIRRNTAFDLSDATALAAQALTGSCGIQLSKATLQFSQNLFIGVVMNIAYEKENGTLKDVIDYLVDPTWNASVQLLLYLRNDMKSFQQPAAAKWREDFSRQIDDMESESADALVKQCYSHWKMALRWSGKTLKKPKRLLRAHSVFNQEAIVTTLAKISGRKSDKKANGEFILERAQANHGYRTIPNSKTALANLEKIKAEYENLAEPIARLQSRLALAGCMKPVEFYIPPMLLLGKPGIGKTYLAMQLARALRVPMEKISAGGAQAGFQLTGSHSSYTDSRPGSIMNLLATGESAAPVFVVDEVDKIGGGTYPVLPVLLDLMERETARHFKDEFFELAFDASKIIFILTANSLDGVPPPLVSRCDVFEPKFLC